MVLATDVQLEPLERGCRVLYLFTAHGRRREDQHEQGFFGVAPVQHGRLNACLGRRARETLQRNGGLHGRAKRTRT